MTDIASVRPYDVAALRSSATLRVKENGKIQFSSARLVFIAIVIPQYLGSYLFTPTILKQGLIY